MKVYNPKPDRAWNPLKNYRNIPCPCGSGLKAKRCHGVQETLLRSDVEKVNAYLLVSSKFPITFNPADTGDE